MGGARLKVALLGDLAVWRASESAPVPLKPRVQALLAWLVLHAGVSHSRSRVAGALWPESRESQARTNLRNLLFRLREALPEVDSCLVLEGQEISWRESAEVEIDLVRFENLAAGAAHLELQDDANAETFTVAVDAYGGELLPGRTEPWIDERRRALTQSFLELADELATYHEDKGELRRAMTLTHRMLEHEPVLEPAHRRCIRLHRRMGDRAGGLRAYHRCVEVLRRELGVEPTKSTTAAYDELAREDESTTPSIELASRTGDFVGRGRELEALRAAWGRARAGGVVVVRVFGDAGIGKTRLASEALAWAREGSGVGAMASCHQGVGASPLGPVVTWLQSAPLLAGVLGLGESERSEIARIVPQVRSHAPHLPEPPALVEAWQRARFTEALVDGLVACGPVILVLDDVQWADSDTLGVVHALAQRGAAALVVATERKSDLPASHAWPTLLRDLRRQDVAVDLELGPLDLEHTVALARSLLGSPPEPALGPKLFAKTEGNALFVVEFLRGGGLVRDEAKGGMPPTVQSVIEGRLAALTDQAAQLLSVLGIADAATGWGVLVRAMGIDEARATDAVDELWRRGLVVESGGDGYRLSHGLIGEVVRGQLSVARKRLVHRQVAEALVETDAPAARVAHHFEAAAQHNRALTWHQRAAKAQRRIYANADAIASLERALALVPSGERAGEQSLSIRESLGEVLRVVGRNEEAVLVCREAAELVDEADGLRRARLLKGVALALEVSDHVACLQACDEAAAALESGRGPGSVSHSRMWVSVHLIRLACSYWRGDAETMREGVKLLTPQLLGVAALQDRVAFHQIMVGLAHRRNRYAWDEDVAAHTEAFLAAARDCGDDHPTGAASFVLGFAKLGGGDVEGALAPLSEGLRLAVQTGDAWLELRAVTYLALRARRAGDWVALSEHNPRVFELAEHLKMPGYRAVGDGNSASMALREGEVAATLKLARRARDAWTRSAPAYPFKWSALAPLLAALVARGELEEDAEELRECAASLLAPSQQWLPDDLTEALAETERSGGRAEAARAVELAQELGIV